ncbi:MAG: hypothetical protein PHT40_00955 [Patescibacteria group bacterium]|nr:hypothetical protein [Patescibacteria group bacterium]
MNTNLRELHRDYPPLSKGRCSVATERRGCKKIQTTTTPLACWLAPLLRKEGITNGHLTQKNKHAIIEIDNKIYPQTTNQIWLI